VIAYEILKTRTPYYELGSN